MFQLFGSAVKAIGSDCCFRDKQEEKKLYEQGKQPVRLQTNEQLMQQIQQDFNFDQENNMVLEDSHQVNNFQQYNQNTNFSQENQPVKDLKVKESYRQKKSQQDSMKQNSSSNMQITSGKPNKSNKKNVKNWSKQEDDILKAAIIQYKGDWIAISNQIGTRNPQQCKQRWTRIQPENKNRKHWTEQEDELVKKMVLEGGVGQRQWGTIAQTLGNGRNGKQVRERYLNVLDESINRGKWEKEEDNLIIQKFMEIGPKWSEISKYLEGRPENMVKNRFYSHIKKTLNQNIQIDYCNSVQEYTSEVQTSIMDNYSNQVEIPSSQVAMQYQGNSMNNLDDVPIKMEENGGESIFHPQNVQSGTNNMIDNNYVQNMQITKNNSSFYNNQLINNNNQNNNNNFNGVQQNMNGNQHYQNNNFNNNGVLQEQEINLQNSINQLVNGNGNNIVNGNGYLNQENQNQQNSVNDGNESNGGYQKQFSLNGSNKEQNFSYLSEDDQLYFGVDKQQFYQKQNSFRLSQSVSSGSYKNGYNFREANYMIQNDFKQFKDINTQNSINNIKIQVERAKQNNDIAEQQKLKDQMQNIIDSIQYNASNNQDDPINMKIEQDQEY